MEANRPLVMGIINVTPDSFADGGRYYALEDAKKRAAQLVHDGADIIDIGGESTRPGALAVSSDEELDRVIPVVEWASRQLDVQLSIDTHKYEVAKEAFSLGIRILNDVSAGTDVRLADLVKAHDATWILMHRQGTAETMQLDPQYPRGVVTEVMEFFKGKTDLLMGMGIAKRNLWIDPGIGFGKTLAHNLDLLRSLHLFLSFGARTVIGTSKKSFLSKLEPGDIPINERDAGTLASNLWAYTKGATVFRVHEVLPMKRALKAWQAIEKSSWMQSQESQ